MYSNLEDKELMKKVQEGNNDAFSEIFTRYHNPLHSLFTRILHDPNEADDMVQKTFLRLFKSRNSYDTSSNGFKTWFFTMANNLLLTKIKRQNRKIYYFSPEFLESFSYKNDGIESSLEQKVIDNELILILEKSIDKLKNKYRLPLLYFYYHNKSYNEIAGILNITSQCVKTRLNRAKEKLRKDLEVLSS